MAFELTADQTLAVEDRGGPLLVSAAAGAGKTRVLVERLLKYVRSGADVDRFLIITFTNAAAAELRARVLGELNEALAQEPSDRHLRRQLTLVYQAQISTIHAFCGQLLRQWGYLIDLERDYRLCDAAEAKLLRQEALETTLERRYESPDKALDTLLDVLEPGREDVRLGDIVLTVFEKLQSYSDPKGWLHTQKADFCTDGLTDAAQTIWGVYLLERYRAMAGYWYDRLAPMLEACRVGVESYLEGMEATVTSLDALRRARTWEEARFPDFRNLNPVKKDQDRDLAEAVKGLREACKEQFNKEAEPLRRASGELLDDLSAVAPAMEALVELIEQFSGEYRALKGRRGVLDFNDLEHLTLELLTTHPEVAREWSDKLDEVMVDEYQDTNQVQNAIFDALTRDKGNLFMVGDVKQSIYRFRLADPSIFLEKYRAYPPSAQATPGQGRRVILGENFRSRPEVVDCVNYLFENLMSRELGELDYGPNEALKCGGDHPQRPDCAVELHVVHNPVAEEGGADAMVEPRFIARRLRELLDSGFEVSDGQGGLRAAEPRDMAILLRSPNQVIGRYTRALDELGIPWASEGGEDFFDAPETSVALSYLEIIDNPRQDVPLIAVLRSPLYGYTPDRLAKLREQKGDGCFYDALVREEESDSVAFLQQLQGLREIAQDKRSYELLWEVYCRTGLLGFYCAMPDGEERRAHLLALYNFARQYESGGHKGLFGFLNHLRRSRERGEALIEPGAGATDGVRILSIHRSKGLEFPVVVVGGLGKQFNRKDNQEPMLFHREMGLGPLGIDPERSIQYPTLARWAVQAKQDAEMLSEELRLLYVALTRAREKLIMVCALRDVDRELDKLIPEAQTPLPSQFLRRQNTVGHWVLAAALCRPEARDTLRGGRPLEHVSPADTFFGEGWEMAAHSGEDYLRRPTHPGPRAAAGEGGPAATLGDFLWRYPWAQTCDLPSKLTATQLKGRTLDAETAEDAGPQTRPILFDRPDFALQKGLTAGERGTAHHLVMQYLDYARTDSLEAIRGEIHRLAQAQLITPQQAGAVDPEVLLDFFRSPIGREVLAAGEELHREFKFSLLESAQRYWPGLPPGETVLLQGVVDCWFDTPQGLVILDFKSDRVSAETVAARAEEYRPQLEAYAQALSTLLERPVARKVLWFFMLGREIEL